MKILKSLAVWFFIVCAIFAGFVFVFDPIVPVSINEMQAQTALSAKLPLSGQSGQIEYQVHQGASFDFQDRDQIAIVAPFMAKPIYTKASRFEGVARAPGKPVFRDGNLYVQDLKNVRLEGDFVLSDRVKALGGFLKGALNKLGVDGNEGDTPLNSADLEKNALAFLSKKLGDIPVYKTADQAWYIQLAGATVKEIKVSDNNLTAMLSFKTTLTGALLIFSIVMMIASLAVASYRTGFWGVLSLLSLGLFSSS